jgi:microcystin-dependent protein
MSEQFVGEIRMFAGDYAPENWALCNGATLQVSQYQALFSLIGTTYGGDGVSTFALPDLRGRIPIGQGQGPGLTARIIGQKIGTETVVLTPGQIPAHNHLLNAWTGPAAMTTAGAGLLADTSSVTVSGVPLTAYQTASTPSISLVTLDTSAIGSTGSSGDHPNMMPYRVINFIIALVGLYPTRP